MLRSNRCLMLGLLSLLGCQRDSAHAVPPPSATRALSESHSAATKPARVATQDPAVRRMALAERLASEAQARPARAVRASELVRALASRGIPLAPPHQVLASPIDASYCQSSSAPSGLVLALCEFQDPASARRGAQRSHALFDALVPKRVLIEHENTLLTLAGAETVEAHREAELARSAFLALAPTPLSD
jgi:hypothetical protein